MNPDASDLNSSERAAAMTEGADSHMRQDVREVRNTNLAGTSAGTDFTAFLPLLLIAAALLSWSGFQTFQLIQEGNALNRGITSQGPLLQNATKMRQSLDAIASQTQKLADQGNPNAKLLVDELKRRGITINASTSTTTIPGAAPVP